MRFETVCKDIRALKIQGAINVAKSGAAALYDLSKKIRSDDPNKDLSKLKAAYEKLIEARATEPALRNALSFLLKDLDMNSSKRFHSQLSSRYKTVSSHFDDAERKITEFGVRKIKDGSIVFTHCHSSTVCNILKQAKKSGIRFEVYNTETRPLYQGRRTAIELSKAGIPVTHYVDSAARHAIKKADVVFIGADAITTTKIYNKIGSETFCMLATSMDIPVYCCTDSWKFDPDSVFGFDEEIEKRHSEEVWPDAPKKVKIYNYAFDMISPKYVTAIISELGVYGHSLFVDEVQDSLKPKG